MTEPPNTEALLATVREALQPVQGELHWRDALAALDAIASELEELPGLWQAVKDSERRAVEAEAELERVRAERDEVQTAWQKNVSDLTEQYGVEYRLVQARLDRAVEALRTAEANLDAGYARSRVRAALAEIEESG